MEATFNTLTDKQRLEALNNVYKKGLSTPKEELAFSTDKLIYLKPFITKLQSDSVITTNPLSNLVMVRQVIDELLRDIKEEIDATCSRLGQKRAEKIAIEYGLQVMADQYEDDFYYKNKVA